MRQSSKQMVIRSYCQQMISIDVREIIQLYTLERWSMETNDSGSGRLFDHGRYPRRLP